jgi:hypothetical protein
MYAHTILSKARFIRDNVLIITAEFTATIPRTRHHGLESSGCELDPSEAVWPIFMQSSPNSHSLTDLTQSADFINFKVRLHLDTRIKSCIAINYSNCMNVWGFCFVFTSIYTWRYISVVKTKLIIYNVPIVFDFLSCRIEVIANCLKNYRCERWHPCIL